MRTTAISAGTVEAVRGIVVDDHFGQHNPSNFHILRTGDDGNVIFVGQINGYGNAIIVQHSGGYVTVYGHDHRNLVSEGARIARGQQIAEIGTSGRTSGPNLHFEVRYNNQAQNPLAYLPEPNSSTRITFARNGGS